MVSRMLRGRANLWRESPDTKPNQHTSAKLLAVFIASVIPPPGKLKNTSLASRSKTSPRPFEGGRSSCDRRCGVMGEKNGFGDWFANLSEEESGQDAGGGGGGGGGAFDGFWSQLGFLGGGAGEAGGGEADPESQGFLSSRYWPTSFGGESPSDGGGVCALLLSLPVCSVRPGLLSP